MKGSFSSRSSSALPAALLLLASSALAIEPPKPATAPPEPPPAQPAPQITPSDESAFYRKLQYVTHYRNLQTLSLPDGVVDHLADAQADRAVEVLSRAADSGSREANVALVRVQHWCGGVMAARPDPEARIAKLGELPATRAARAAGVLYAEAEFLKRARVACGQARFDYRAIEARLRQSAEAGDPTSAVELAQFVRDPAQRESLLQAAADAGYAPALYAQATALLMAVQRGETTENVSAIRELLKVAGRTLPKAKLDLANCMALGCDGHPADALTARAFGIDAARDGEPTAFLSMVRMPWGRRLSRAQLLGWQYFGDKLNEAGCAGDAYVPTSIGFAQTLAMLERGQDEKSLEAGRKELERLWSMHGERAMSENGCQKK